MIFDNGSVDSLAQMEQAGFTLTIERWQMMSTLLFRSQTNIYKAGIIFHFLELSLCHASILAVSLPPRLNRRLSFSSFRGSPLPFKRASRFLFGCHFSMILLILRSPPLLVSTFRTKLLIAHCFRNLPLKDLSLLIVNFKKIQKLTQWAKSMKPCWNEANIIHLATKHFVKF